MYKYIVIYMFYCD